jgi:hypothetical protein
MEREAQLALDIPAVGRLLAAPCNVLAFVFWSAAAASPLPTAEDAVAGLLRPAVCALSAVGASKCIGSSPSIRSGCARAIASSPPDITTKLSMHFSYQLDATAMDNFSSAHHAYVISQHVYPAIHIPRAAGVQKACMQCTNKHVLACTDIVKHHQLALFVLEF